MTMFYRALVTFVMVSALSACVYQADLGDDVVREVCLTEGAAESRYASYSPSGDRIVFETNVNGDWDIYLMAADGSNPTRLTIGVSDDRRPSWHPDGARILFESNRSGMNGLYTINIDSMAIEAIKLSEIAAGIPMFARFSPDGEEIAVSLRESDEKSNIALFNKTGEFNTFVTNSDQRNFYAQWSNNSKELVFHSRKDTNNEDDEIYRWNAENGKSLRLTNWSTHNFCPSWSPDGMSIAYVTSMPESRPEIYLMNADGSNQKRITFNNDGETLPNWSPDGTSLLITAYRGNSYQICSLKLR